MPLPGIVSTPIWLDIVRPTGWPITFDITREMGCIEFLRLFFRNSKFWNQNSDFLIFQQRNPKINPAGIFGIKNGITPEFCFQWGSQKLEPKIRIPSEVSLRPAQDCSNWILDSLWQWTIGNIACTPMYQQRKHKVFLFIWMNNKPLGFIVTLPFLSSWACCCTSSVSLRIKYLPHY